MHGADVTEAATAPFNLLHASTPSIARLAAFAGHVELVKRSTKA